ncbi:MAG: peptidylprolyl isomerase [Myxococcales bacterium]|nr:peptidylprolyl isomerase [Planctomycetota bacterium]MCA9656854.1 peptidylprolyl isomerase [Myxococcales bacterium]
MSETKARLKTDKGDIVIEFCPDVAPKHVENFKDLTRRGFYTNKIFHRVIPNFMIQGGCATGTGTGGHPDGITLDAEFNDRPHVPGAVSAARTNDPNSAGTQFFICHGRHSSFLDGKYTVFGQVIEGMDVVDQIVNAPRDPSNDRPHEAISMGTVTLED